ncbi:MAG: hypothetical protein FWB72_04420 [Firmicutes bacterium]|nr:hypothetical protein [Bacillota bacterium]
MNIGRSHYYFNRTLMFNDVMKTRHHLRTRNGWHFELNVDLAEDGYPVGINFTDGGEYAVIILINNIYSGDFVFLYEGDGDFEFVGGMEVISRVPNQIRLKLTEPLQAYLLRGEDHRWIVIRRSCYANRVRNTRLIPVRYLHREHRMPLFRNDFLDGLRPMHNLRFMDAVDTNGSRQMHWEDRPRMNDWTYDVNGLPLEYLIKLANVTNSNAWFCVPHMATDDYIRQMARLIRDNLNSSLKVYIEFSNEIWHTGFEQGRWMDGGLYGASDSLRASLAHIEYTYGTVWNDRARHLRQAYLMERVFRIFEAEFSGRYRNRLVTVGVKTHLHLPFMQQTIDFWKARGTMPDAIANSGYFSFTEYDHNRWMQNPSAISADDVLDAVFARWEEIATGVKEMSQLIVASGARLIVYEGGQHMQPHNQGVWPYNQAVWDSQIHPRMYELYMKNFRLHASVGVDLFMHFSYIGERQSQWGSWGALENTGDTQNSRRGMRDVSPKFAAILDANSRRGILR